MFKFVHSFFREIFAFEIDFSSELQFSPSARVVLSELQTTFKSFFEGFASINTGENQCTEWNVKTLFYILKNLRSTKFNWQPKLSSYLSLNLFSWLKMKKSGFLPFFTAMFENDNVQLKNWQTCPKNPTRYFSTVAQKYIALWTFLATVQKKQQVKLTQINFVPYSHIRNKHCPTSKIRNSTASHENRKKHNSFVARRS